MHNVKGHHIDMVAQAAGHLSQDEYHLGINPEEGFQEFSNMMKSWLQSYLDVMRKVLLHTQS